MIQKSENLKSRHLIIGLAILTLSACDLLQEPKPPTFSNTLEFPLINASVTLEDLENEDNIVTQLYDGEGNRTIFAYDDFSVMDSQEVGDQLAFGDINKSFAQSVDDVTVTGSTINQSSGFEAVGVDSIQKEIQSEIGLIELSDIPATSTDNFLLSEIFPSVNALLGQNTAIPGGDLLPVRKPFAFDDFSSANFESGFLDITINNDLAIPLGDPVTITLKEVVGIDTLAIQGGAVQWGSPIAVNSSETQSLDLSGMTLPGEILVEVTGSTAGTGGTVILIDAGVVNSSFNIDIAGRNMVVSSATAKVPAQNISESGSITLADSENKIQEARIKAGSLSINIDNSMEVASVMTLTIPSLQDGDQNDFTTTINIPANSPVVDVNDIAGFSLVMDTNLQEVQYNYLIDTEDTGDALVTLAETDQVSVTIALAGANVGEQIFFDRIIGIIESQNIDESGEIEIASESKLLIADISSGTISIAIDNQVNKPGFAGLPTIVLTIPELLDASSNPLTGSLTLEPSPTANTMFFQLADYSLVFPDTATQMLTYSTMVTTPTGEVGSYGLEDSIYVDIEVSDMSFTSVTGYFSQDAIVESNEILLGEATKLTEAIFESGDFALSMTNRIGVLADVDFEISEFLHRITNQPLTMSFRLADIADPQINYVDLSNYKLAFDTALPGIDQAIHYTSSVSLPSDEEMTLTFGDSILIDVNISNLAMERVTGIIAPDTLIIEETEQEITLPDQVSDLLFERVNIDIDFHSTFTIPIQLSLNLSGTDSLGNTVVINIVHDLTPEDDVVHIDAAEILNIHPTAILAGGQAIIGDGFTESSIIKGQSMKPIMHINVPLSFILDDPDPIDVESTDIDSPLPTDNTVSLDEVVLYADVMNLFEFGASVVVLASNDSLTFDSSAIAQGTAPPADTLFTLDVLPQENAPGTTPIEVNEILLGTDRLQLFEERMFLKPSVQLLGRRDGQGNSLPSRFFSTDSLTVRTWGRITYTINGEAL